MFMNERVVSRSVAAHQFHRCPVFLAFLRIQRQPGQALQLAREIRELAERQFAVVVANSRAGSTTAAMRQQGQVGAGFKARTAWRGYRPVGSEQPELHEMIAAAASAQL